jgi:hypothetical protein
VGRDGQHRRHQRIGALKVIGEPFTKKSRRLFGVDVPVDRSVRRHEHAFADVEVLVVGPARGCLHEGGIECHDVQAVEHVEREIPLQGRKRISRVC